MTLVTVDNEVRRENEHCHCRGLLNKPFIQGKFIMETKSKLARSPDGNGGLYWALRQQGVLEDLEKKLEKFMQFAKSKNSASNK